MILDPRHYRVDDLLRRPYDPAAPFGPSGENLWAASPQGWGFRGGVYFGCSASDLAPFTLVLRADGEEVEVGDALARPSHVTLHGRHPGSGLQITEDKFITRDDTLVSVLSLRNPDESTVDVTIDYGWGIAPGENTTLGETPVWVRRDAPPGDDLRQRLPPGARCTLVFAVSIADTRDAAFRRAAEWREHSDPVRAQSEAYQGWFDQHVPRFDCPDPWLTKLWYHRWQSVRRLQGETPVAAGAVEALSGVASSDLPAALAKFAYSQFTDGDYTRPGPEEDDAALRRDVHGPLSPALAEYLIYQVLGIALGKEGRLALRPAMPPPGAGSGGWEHFCLENISFRDQLLTIVWDDPRDYGNDAYQDGDKGFTIYADGRRIFHQEDLAPVEVELPL